MLTFIRGELVIERELVVELVDILVMVDLLVKEIALELLRYMTLIELQLQVLVVAVVWYSI